MTEGDSGMAIALDAITEWLLELRKELKEVRYRALSIEGLDSMQIRIQTVEIESKLVEIYLSLLTKPLEATRKFNKSES